MKGYQSRKRGIRKPKRIIVIVCEGKKTEIQYFKGFRERNSGVEIEPIHGKCTDIRSMIKFAKEKISYYGINFKEGDGLWCAFDVDDKKNQEIVDMTNHASRKKINMAISNPSIELWFLLHHKEILSGLTRFDALKKLREFLPRYEKNEPIFSQLSNKLPVAIKNAKKLNKIHIGKDIDLYSRESNPSSQVFQLIEFIQDTIQHNKS